MSNEKSQEAVADLKNKFRRDSDAERLKFSNDLETVNRDLKTNLIPQERTLMTQLTI